MDYTELCGLTGSNDYVSRNESPIVIVFPDRFPNRQAVGFREADKENWKNRQSTV